MTYIKKNTYEFILISSLSILFLFQIMFAFSIDARANNSKLDSERQNVCTLIGCGIGFKVCGVVTYPGPLDDPLTCYEVIFPIEEEISQN